MDNRGEVWKTFIVLVPLLAASLMAVSRIMDARHHPFDVITGAMLGQFMAWVAYRQYFPPLTEPKKKGHAYPPRTWTLNSQEVAIDQGMPGYSAALRMEEGRTASSESLGSEGRTRKRAPPMQGSTPSTMRSHSDFEMVAHVGGHGSHPLPHREPLPSWEGSGYRDSRGSIDVGDTRGAQEFGFERAPSGGLHRGES
jgi:hypothetical protein